jgi:hypothetical protein
MDVFEELSQTRAALLDTIAGLGEDALDRKGVVGEWSIKNVLAHIAAWESWVVQALPARMATGETPEHLKARLADEDASNAAEVAEREELTPAEQLMELERTRDALLAYLRELDAAAWERRRPWNTWEGSLAEYLHAALSEHEAEHIADLRAAAEKLRG